MPQVAKCKSKGGKNVATDTVRQKRRSEYTASPMRTAIDQQQQQPDDFQERQDNEFALLQSVYARELRDLRLPAPWNAWRPLDMVLTLSPQQSTGGVTEVHAQIDLHVRCSQGYPEDVPELTLENARGLSKGDLDELQTELDRLAYKWKGEVMILELAQRVQTYLHVHNKPLPGSFYEEMLDNRRRQEEARIEEDRRNEANQRAALQEEIHRRQEEIREEERQWKEQQARQQLTNVLRVSGSNRIARSLSPPHLGAVTPTTILSTIAEREFLPRPTRRGLSKSDSQSSRDPPTCGHFGVSEIRFSCRGTTRVIQRGKCLGHGLRDGVTFSGMDVATGELVVVKEWTLAHPRNADSLQNDEVFRNCTKQLATVEQEMASLSKLQHPHLVHYSGIICSSSDAKVGRVVVVQVLQEFVAGGHLGRHLTDGIAVDCDLLRHYATGVLEALEYLHRNSVVHKDLRHTSVFVDNSGLVRVADYSLDKRLFEISDSINRKATEGLFPPTLGRGGKRGDIFRFGVLCLSLVRGDIVNGVTPDVVQSLPTVLCDFLEKCSIQNEQERWSVEQLLGHEFLKPSIGYEPTTSASCTSAEEPKSQEPNESLLPAEASEIPEAEPSGSRLLKEFDLLSWLGRGGFGNVYKVRNKLDGGVYAIKRISLNPSNKQLNRKITREVKLLSRLNHENVVRYFNSWMETAWVERQLLDEEDEDATDDADHGGGGGGGKSDVDDGIDVVSGNSDSTVNRCAGSKADASVEWSVSFEFSKRPTLDDDSSDDEDDEDVFGGTSFLPNLDASDEIVFENDGKADEASPEDYGERTDVVDGCKVAVDDEGNDGRRIVHFLYIQMELCDRSTLRDAIDSGGLHEDEPRMWRLFREIVEGLAHIHQQGMIHRDLKPVNIFLDSGDHVKIGDFGLATTRVDVGSVPSTAMPTTILLPVGCGTGSRLGVDSRSESACDKNLTTWVGTALYVSPEMADSSSRKPYNQKVDVYSLGIMLFEMCFHPLTTAMERVKVLSNLRRPEIVLPDGFDEKTRPRETTLVRWLLDHDPARRPTTQELLQSRHLPPPQLEEAEMHDLFFHTISNPQSKIYKHLVCHADERFRSISSLLEQRQSTAADVTYDMDVHRGAFCLRTTLVHRFVLRTLVRVFERHGALPVSTPLLVPKSDDLRGATDEVAVVDHGGGVVTLPYDLRVPFCRFLVKNRVTNLKRYHIAPVYRERKVYGTHPRALFEGAFDIVTPSPASLLVDAEVVQVVWEVLCDLPPLKGRGHLLRLNHSSLLRGILAYCGVPNDKHEDVCLAIADVKTKNVGRTELRLRLARIGVAEHATQAMLSVLETEWPIRRLAGLARSLQAKRPRALDAAALIDRGVAVLEELADHLGVADGGGGGDLTITVTPGLVYGARHFSGLVFQFACSNLRTKKRRKKSAAGFDILAAGGRYDRLVTRMRSTMDLTANPSDCCQTAAVGVSIAVEKLVSAVVDCEDFDVPGAYDVLVCSMGRQMTTTTRTAIGRLTNDLRQAGLSVHGHHDCADSLDSIHELCHEWNVSRVAVLKDNDPHNIKLHALDRDRFTETSVPASNVVEVLQRELHMECGCGCAGGGGGGTSSQATSYFASRGGEASSHSRIDRTTSESSSAAGCHSVVVGGGGGGGSISGAGTGGSGVVQSRLKVTFATLEKLVANARRRYESQITSQLAGTLQLFSAKIGVSVVAVDLKADVLCTISCHVQTSAGEKEFERAVASVIEKHPRHKKCLTKLADHLSEQIFEKRSSVVILYGLVDGSYRVLV